MTEVSLVSAADIKIASKKNGWLFDQKSEFNSSDREIYKLTILNNLQIIQGLMSITLKPDHVFLKLIESAKFNRGAYKVYEGVPGNLVAFACRLSFQRGSEGYLAFHSKSKLIEHYQNTLDAVHYGNQLMVIETHTAQNLVNRYFKSQAHEEKRDKERTGCRFY